MIACAQTPSTSVALLCHIWTSKAITAAVGGNLWDTLDASSQIAVRQHLCWSISVTFSSHYKQHLWNKHLKRGTILLSHFSFASGGEFNFCALLTNIHIITRTNISMYYTRVKEGRQANFEWKYQCRAGNWESSTLKVKRLPGGDVTNSCILEKLLSPIVLK